MIVREVNPIPWSLPLYTVAIEGMHDASVIGLAHMPQLNGLNLKDGVITHRMLLRISPLAELLTISGQ
jgi:hypothetical protein